MTDITLFTGVVEMRHALGFSAMGVDSPCATCLLVATILSSAGAYYEGTAFSFFNLYLRNIADGGCWTRGPVNPPRLVMTSDTDMTIQLFMQATILLSNYYGYNTIRYSEIRERASRSGLNMIPFMPPETVRATPELVGFFNTYENNGPAGQHFEGAWRLQNLGQILHQDRSSRVTGGMPKLFAQS